MLCCVTNCPGSVFITNFSDEFYAKPVDSRAVIKPVNSHPNLMYHRGIPGMVWLFILGCFWSLANYGHLQFCHHTLTINGIQSCMALMIFLAAFGGHVSTLPPALPPGRGFQRVLDPQTPIFPPAAGTSPLLCPPGPLYSLY